MRYGLTLPNGGIAADARTRDELAHIAEESGWDGVFLEDYIVWQGHNALRACRDEDDLDRAALVMTASWEAPLP